jgi:ankyrin repeat protein
MEQTEVQRSEVLVMSIRLVSFSPTAATLLLGATLSAQTPGRVDFAKDIQPLLRQNCLGCHGPAVQQGGMRLDRKSSAMKPFSRRITPGNSANSMVYHRISGTEYGAPMPPTGSMRPEQIALLKAWIDQGAEWPDALSAEKELPPLNPKAVSLVDSLRTGELASFMKVVKADRSLLNARGPEGSTPFMYAVLYTGADTLTELLKLGADPNKRNDANATALMWAARDFAKTKVLVEHGADVNAKSDDLRTPLMIAARRNGAAAIVQYLLDHKANPNPNATPVTQSSPLLEALTSGDASIVEMLMRRGADAGATGEMGINMAGTLNCSKCFDLIVPKIKDKQVFTAGLQFIAVYADLKSVRMMLDHGADVNAYDPLGRTPLMYAVISDALSLDVVKLLVDRGADVNAKSRHPNSGDSGITVLDIAKRNGDLRIIDFLVKSGAKETAEPPAPTLKPRQNNTIRKAIQDSLPLLQRADAGFTAKSGCVSCHNDSMTAMAIGLARSRGFQIDEKMAAKQVQVNVLSLEKTRDQLHQGFGLPVGDMFFDFLDGYVALGLHAEGYKPDLNTDAVVLLTLSRQAADGNWPYPRSDMRPPICLNYISQTVISMRTLQLYAPKPVKPAADKAIQKAAAWLVNAKPSSTEDRIWRLRGLVWSSANKATIQGAMKELLAAQRPDGGWPDLPTMESSAFETGGSLVSLYEAGLPTSDPAYQRGIKFLLDTQQEDGSWYVKTRALGFQPAFDAGFPHGPHQFLSAAGTGWAAMALTLTLPEASQSTRASLNH